jgi:hypothetical protein
VLTAEISICPMTSFYALEPHGLVSRFFRIHITEHDLRGVWIGGQIYDEDSAYRATLSAQLLAPLIKLWTDRCLRQVRLREHEYDGMNLTASDDFLRRDRRNFLIPKAEMVELRGDRKKRLHTSYSEIAGTLRLRLRDGTRREWIIVGEQNLDAIAASLGPAGLQADLPPAPVPRYEVAPAEPAAPPRDDLVAELLAAPPPRKVSADMMRAAHKQEATSAMILCGVIITVMAAGLIAFFVHRGTFRDWELNTRQTVQTGGQVIAVRKSDRPDRDGHAIYVYDFTFSPTGDSERQAISFTTGQIWSAGASVDVEYAVAAPALARIVGGRATRVNLPGAQLVMFLLPVPMGLAILLNGLWNRRRVNWLLQKGTLGEAKVQSVTPLPQRIRGHKLHKITLLRIGRGNYPIVTQRYQPRLVAFYQARLASGQPIYILIEPSRPKRALVPETLAWMLPAPVQSA